MADLARIKSNVAKMASQNAPESDIDGYIASEGSNVDEVRNFRPGPPQNPIIKFGKDLASETGKQANQFAYGADDEAALGAFDAMKNKKIFNMDPGQPENFMQGAARMAGRGTGFMIGAPMKAGEAFLSKVAPNAGKVASEAIKFGAGRAASTPVRLAGGTSTPVQEAGAIATDTVLGGALPIASEYGAKVIGAMKKVPAFIKGVGEDIGHYRKPVEFAGEVRNSMFGKRQQLGQALDQSISYLSATNPEKTIDLSPHFNEMKAATLNPDNPGLAADINGTLRKIKDPEIAGLMQDLIRNPENAQKLTLRQAEDIKRAVSQAPTLAAKKALGKFANWTSGDHEILDLLDNIKNSQSEVFPELSEVRKPYADYMHNYNQVKNSFKPASLLNKMRGKFGNEEVEGMVKKVLPQETWNKVKGFRNTGKVLTGAGVLGAEETARNLVLPALGKAFRGKT